MRFFERPCFTFAFFYYLLRTVTLCDRLQSNTSPLHLEDSLRYADDFGCNLTVRILIHAGCELIRPGRTAFTYHHEHMHRASSLEELLSAGYGGFCRLLA